MRTLVSVSLLSLLLLPACSTLGTASDPIVDQHAPQSSAVVQLRRATLPQPLTAIAVHYWFSAWNPSRSAWERWEVWQDADVRPPSWGHVHRDLVSLDSNVGGGNPVVERQWFGADAEALLAALRRSPSYPDRDVYRAWPGPNSNTYVAWVLREAGVGADLDPRAIGKDWRGFVGVGLTTTGTGIQFSTPLLGFTIGFDDGLSLQLLCLTFGVKPAPPAIKTMFGSLGAPEQ